MRGCLMFVPHYYRPESPHGWLDIVESYPLATLVTSASPYPRITHLPIVVDRDCDRVQCDTLLGHMNRSNPHWLDLVDGCPGVLIFNGPNAYISPAYYEQRVASPTWNFVSVHVSGTIHPIVGGKPTMDVVRKTVRTFESSHGQGWDDTHSIEYFESIVSGVGAFRFRVSNVDSMFKLSQEKDSATQRRVIDRLMSSGRSADGDIANLMRPSGSDQEHRGGGCDSQSHGTFGQD
ncbi:FMN-binding negative transcriptional regulator [Nocardia sp. NPDC057663]|uniref:FMN-binding negative transcriptional regulator n=1 Tax=Nocardia sp. NPDC057663 TaxID=3346201 RepID=UPI00366A8872